MKDQLLKYMKGTMREFSEKEIRELVALLAVFVGILGSATFIFYPAGVTYGAYPMVYFSIFIFGMWVSHALAPDAVSSVRFSKKGMVAVVILIIVGILSVWPTGFFVDRSIKLFEILFQDFVIAAILGVVGTRLASTHTRVNLAIVFGVLHLPLFITAPRSHSISVALAAFFVSYISTTLFVKTKQDITTVLLPHLAFYIVFGSILSIVVW